MHARFRLRIVATFGTAIATIALMSDGSAPARAQTYDPNYPVCMQIYGRSSYFVCHYASLEQCGSLAATGSTSCVVNPYFAPKKPAAARRSRRVD